MKIICIIPARGGSKRIPRKNIKQFCGKPIISYSIEAAVKADIFDEIMVSTDDLEIAEIAKKYGATVPFFRSSDTSNDYATTFDVLNEVLAEYDKKGNSFEYLCCLYPCAPFVSSKILAESYATLLENDIQSVVPVCKFPAPIEWAIDIQDNLIKFKNMSNTLIRSQDLTPSYYDAGMFYFSKIKDMLMNKSLVLEKSMPVIINEREVQDIDDLEDWKLAEVKYKSLMER